MGFFVQVWDYTNLGSVRGFGEEHTTAEDAVAWSVANTGAVADAFEEPLVGVPLATCASDAHRGKLRRVVVIDEAGCVVAFADL